MSSKEQIHQLVIQQERAIQAKDIDASMAQYATDVLSFDVVNSLQKVGRDACRERLEAWLAQFPGAFAYTIEQLAVTAGEELAYCHSINYVKGTRVSGDEIDMRWRATVCYQQTNGQWLITHEHSSVPFDVETGKALMSLKP